MQERKTLKVRDYAIVVCSVISLVGIIRNYNRSVELDAREKHIKDYETEVMMEEQLKDDSAYDDIGKELALKRFDDQEAVR